MKDRLYPEALDALKALSGPSREWVDVRDVYRAGIGRSSLGAGNTLATLCRKKLAEVMRVGRREGGIHYTRSFYRPRVTESAS